MKFSKVLIVLVMLMYTAVASAEAQYFTTGNGLPKEYTEVKVTNKQSGPTLLFSDSPEMVYENGVLYEDTVSGDVRIFFHHVNAMTTNKKLAVIMQNDEQLRPYAYKFSKKGVGVDSWNYMYAGKTSQSVYFTEDYTENGTLGFCNSKEILSGQGVILQPGKLLVGTIDLHVDKPTKFMVVMCDVKTDLEIFAENGKRLPMDEHPLRGTFTKSDWYCKVDTPIAADKNEVYMLELASEEQGFARGIDATTGKKAKNNGNYGVMYTVEFDVTGKDTALYLNPLGGLFAGYGVLEHNGERKLIGLPGNSLAIGARYDDLLKIADLKPGSYKFIWSPPGASNLPVRFYWMK